MPSSNPGMTSRSFPIPGTTPGATAVLWDSGEDR